MKLGHPSTDVPNVNTMTMPKFKQFLCVCSFTQNLTLPLIGEWWGVTQKLTYHSHMVGGDFPLKSYLFLVVYFYSFSFYNSCCLEFKYFLIFYYKD